MIVLLPNYQPVWYTSQDVEKILNSRDIVFLSIVFYKMGIPRQYQKYSICDHMSSANKTLAMVPICILDSISSQLIPLIHILEDTEFHKVIKLLSESGQSHQF